MGKISLRLIAAAGNRLVGRKLADVRLGLKYTAVSLDDGTCGTAYTHRGSFSKNCDITGELQSIIGGGLEKPLLWANSDDALKRTVGCAVVNTACNKDAGNFITGDIREVLRLQPDDEVVMVGYFEPLADYIERTVKALYIFDLERKDDNRILDTELCSDYLRRCDAALITGTAVVNRSIDSLLENCGNCRETAIAGPSTPLIPSAFEGTPVTLLSGIIVQDSCRMMQTVGIGGGMKDFKSLVKKVNIRLK
ncbi:DUF364 domain-containing protein [bacterium]|nr:DUF364 domain-containing protein [bacterium]